MFMLTHQHIEDLHIVCVSLNQFGLTIRLEKFIFDVSEIDFLFHEICKKWFYSPTCQSKTHHHQ